ncbi:hypothetical protein [Chloroflexus sp. Y-396-1]|uniref:hypothetical protein n=1 Tax=Chloroflexus sp. Y-396-1 TaxID=867845 RepID=UPI0004BC951F|nr:hypothetical protein [Chloroflexus sp. Y-396-1]
MLRKTVIHLRRQVDDLSRVREEFIASLSVSPAVRPTLSDPLVYLPDVMLKANPPCGTLMRPVL